MSSEHIEVTFKDGKQESVPKGTPVIEIFKASGKLEDGWIAARINGNLVDLGRAVTEGGQIEGIKADSLEGLEVLRHSAAHVMAQAVKSLFPEAKITIGPAIESGFYYDFDVDRPFTREDLEKIEEKMARIVSDRHRFQRKEISREEAIRFFEEQGEKYKVELLEGMVDPMVSTYQQGDFIDLCRGPHVPHTGYVKAFKLTSVAGAYWRGDERNPMLQSDFNMLRAHNLVLPRKRPDPRE